MTRLETSASLAFGFLDLNVQAQTVMGSMVDFVDAQAVKPLD